MNTYELNRRYWEISAENPGKLKANHAALYSYLMYVNNKLGWKKEFGFPTLFAMEETNIRSRHTINKTLKELSDFGLVKLVEDSKNQHSAKIVALIKTYKADDKPDTKANTKHDTKHRHGTGTIDKLKNIETNKTIKTINISFDDFWNLYDYKTGSKSKAETKWKSLKGSEREKVIQHVPIYKQRTPDKKFRKHPITYLNQKSWESEDEWKTDDEIKNEVPENETWQERQKRLARMYA